MRIIHVLGLVDLLHFAGHLSLHGKNDFGVRGRTSCDTPTALRKPRSRRPWADPVKNAIARFHRNVGFCTRWFFLTCQCVESHFFDTRHHAPRWATACAGHRVWQIIFFHTLPALVRSHALLRVQSHGDAVARSTTQAQRNVARRFAWDVALQIALDRKEMGRHTTSDWKEQHSHAHCAPVPFWDDHTRLENGF